MPTKAKEPLDHLQSEAQQKLAPKNQAVEVEWEGHNLFVLPVTKWKTSALQALRQGDIETWAERCLTNGTYKLWRQVDPDIEQAETFFEAWTAKTGESRPS